MNERIVQFRVGVMILATILIAAILMFLFPGTSSWMRPTYTIYIKFREAPGVTRGTPIRKDGIRIGRVSNVQFTDDDTGVLVTADIDHERILYTDEECKATSALLMGDASLDFVREVSFQGERKKVEPGAVLEGQMTGDVSGSIAGLQQQAAQTLASLDTAGRDMHEVLTRVNRLVATNEERITRVINDADETMQLLKTALAASNDILGDPKLRAQIKQTISEMPAVLEETRTTVERVGGTFASLQRNMENIEGLTKPLGDRGPALVDELDTSMKKLNLLGDNMLRFSNELNDPQGTLGAVLHDRELYQRVIHIARNVDDLSNDLKPIINNVGVFTDKIARHPSELGVGGALHKGSGVKDAPPNYGTENEVPQQRWPIGGSGQWNVGQ